MQKKWILNNPLASNTASVRCNNMLNVIFLNFQNFNKMKNSILKSALSTFAAKKEVSTKNFEVITSLGSTRTLWYTQSLAQNCILCPLQLANSNKANWKTMLFQINKLQLFTECSSLTCFVCSTLWARNAIPRYRSKRYIRAIGNYLRNFGSTAL